MPFSSFNLPTRRAVSVLLYLGRGATAVSLTALVTHSWADKPNWAEAKRFESLKKQLHAWPGISYISFKFDYFDLNTTCRQTLVCDVMRVRVRLSRCPQAFAMKVKKQNRNINNQGFHKTCHGCFFFDGLGTVWTHLNLESTPTQVGTNLSNNNFTTNKCSSCTPLEPRFFPRCAPGKTFIIEQYVPTNFMETLHTGHCHIFFLTNHLSQNKSFWTMPTKIIRLWV